MWNNKKYITSAEHEYINVKSGDRETACSFLYENSTLRKRIVFRFPHRVIKILSRLLLDSLICSGRAFVLSLFRLWSILILFQRPFITEVTKQNKSLQNAWGFGWFFFFSPLFFPFVSHGCFCLCKWEHRFGIFLESFLSKIWPSNGENYWTQWHQVGVVLIWIYKVAASYLHLLQEKENSLIPFNQMYSL